MLLIFVKVFVEGSGWESNCFRNERCEEDTDCAHKGYVLRVDEFEVGKVRGRGPLCGCEEVAVEWLGGRADWVVS